MPALHHLVGVHNLLRLFHRRSIDDCHPANPSLIERWPYHHVLPRLHLLAIWHSPCFISRHSLCPPIEPLPRTGPAPAPVPSLSTRPAVQNKAHSSVLER